MRTFNNILIGLFLFLFIRGWWRDNFVGFWKRRFPQLTREQKRVRNWVQRKAAKDLGKPLNTDNIFITFLESGQWIVLKKRLLYDKIIYRIDLTDEEMNRIIEENEY